MIVASGGAYAPHTFNKYAPHTFTFLKDLSLLLLTTRYLIVLSFLKHVPILYRNKHILQPIIFSSCPCAGPKSLVTFKEAIKFKYHLYNIKMKVR
ncbi:hypothetical protein Hanom_Chr03g00190791 [Helianthus anomalus]